MYPNSLGSTNNSDIPSSSTVGGSSSTTPLVNASHGTSRMLRKVSDLFRMTSSAGDGRTTADCINNTTHESSGYVEFGHLDNDQPNEPFNQLMGGGSNTISASSQKRTLGTFSGVFSPVALSMFSALIFIRVGYIVGNAGLLITLIQFTIAYVILIFTVASVCAISTNGAVEGGGAYFMISRTLGPEFGGSIGTLFFLANIVSSALCIFGCTEGLVENFGPSGYLVQTGHDPYLMNSVSYRLLYSTALNGISLTLCLIGATMFAKTSVLILAVVTISLFSVFISFFITPSLNIPIPDENKLIFHNASVKVSALYTGLNETTFQDNIYSKYGRDYTSLNGTQIDFAAVFGVLFSGVTGIMAGANMSGELKNPGRSIPIGTMGAVIFTLICYIALAVFTSATCTRELLQNNYMYMMPINVWPPFVAIGVLTATFSAALSNLIGASRVLLALAKDQVFGRSLNIITKGVFRGNPIVAVLVSWGLVQLMLFINSLNLIAQINSVLFLLSYLATNLACVGLQLTSAPNFRPSYKYFSVHTATAGLLGTIVMMFVINPAYAGCSIAACIALVAALHLFTSERGANDTPYWGSISQALIFHQVRKYLLLLDSRKDHVKYWRPQILLLVASPRTACPLIDFINDIKKSGLFVLGHVFVPTNTEPDKLLDISTDPSNRELPLWLELVDHLKVKAFVELTTAKSVREGFQHLARISGMGAMKPNTIVLGFYDQQSPIDFFNHPHRTQFTTSNFDTNYQAFPIHTNKQLDPVQYVLMISDTLNMGKNICLARHFDTLDKSSIPRNSNIKFIDVWTVNILKAFDPEAMCMTTFDTNSLFMMQLATICGMVKVWKKLKLRVFVNVKSAENIQRLEDILKLLRIPAIIHEIEHLNPISNSTESDDDTDSNIGFDYIKQFNKYIQQVSSQCTAVTFIYLPSPPNYKQNPPYQNEYLQFHDNYLMKETFDNDEYYQQTSSNQFNNRQTQLNKNYLKILTDLTDNLPPTMLVHGLNAVTSTTL